MSKSLLRSVIAFFAIIVVLSVVPFGCTCGKKKPGAGNNDSGNNDTGGGGDDYGGNSGDDYDGEGNYIGYGAATRVGNLIIDTSRVGYADKTKLRKLEPGGSEHLDVVIVAAEALAGILRKGPKADTDDNNRGYDDLDNSANIFTIFELKFPGDKPALFFVNRKHVRVGEISLSAVNTCVNSSESADNTLAAQDGGGTCRYYDNQGNALTNKSYLGSMFVNNHNANAARGTLQCDTLLRNRVQNNSFSIIDDTTIFNELKKAACHLGVVNNGATGHEDAMINDAWVFAADATPDGDEIRTAELHAIAISVEGKTIPQWSSQAGFNKATFDGSLDNAAMKKLIDTNPWASLLFRVVILKNEVFSTVSALP